MEEKSSIISEFTFVSYKVTKFELHTQKTIELVAANQNFGPWDLNLAIVIPAFSKKHSCYVCGIALSGKCLTKDQAGNNTELVTFNSEINGIFKVSEPLDKNVEEVLVKTQGPAILLPYLRGTITTFLATAGYGSIAIPLINIQKVSSAALVNTNILTLE